MSTARKVPGTRGPPPATQATQPPPATAPVLEERAKKAGIDLTKLDGSVEDDQNPDRLFSIRYKPYLVPKDEKSRDETKQVDEENRRRHAFNQTQETQIRVLMTRLGQSTWKMHKPGLYHDRALELWRRSIREEVNKKLEAIQFLIKRGRYAGKDYQLDEACDLADDLVIQEFIQAQQKKQGARHSLEKLAPKNHHLHCNCNYNWDGKSDTCSGTVPLEHRLQVRWRTCEDFHFLEPMFEIYLPLAGECEGAAAVASNK